MVKGFKRAVPRRSAHFYKHKYYIYNLFFILLSCNSFALSIYIFIHILYMIYDYVSANPYYLS